MENDIQKIADEYKNKNGNDKITTKDLLWYCVAKFSELENRVSKVESVQKVVLIIFPIIITIVLFIK